MTLRMLMRSCLLRKRGISLPTDNNADFQPKKSRLFTSFLLGYRLTFVVALVLSNFTTNSFAAAAPPLADIQPTFPIRAAFYYPWFPEAWTQLGIYPYTNYTPSLGFYDPTVQTVISQQNAMQYAGIQAGIASWWGQGTATDGRISTLLQAAAGTTFRWAIYYESESLGNSSASQITNDLTYIRDRYGNDPGFLRVGGRFVVFVYADALDACDMADRWKQGNTAGAYIVLKVFGRYTACASQPDSWHQYGPAIAADSQRPYSYTISPGFWLKGDAVRLSRDLTRWNQNIRDMIASGANFQLITTFNEWGEGTSVESAVEWASTSGYGAYLDALHNNGNQPQPTAIKTATPIASAAPTQTATRVPSPTSTVTQISTPPAFMLSFTAQADAQVKESNPNTNYGKFTTLQVDGASDPDVESYMRFAVSGVNGPIQSARVRLYIPSNGSNNGPAIFATSNSWTETGIKWSSRPIHTSGATDNRGNIGVGVWVEYDVTLLVTGNGTFSFVLAADSTDGITFASRESNNAPKLMITFAAAP